jgi:multiple sugar transport system permease protein
MAMAGGRSSGRISRAEKYLPYVLIIPAFAIAGLVLLYPLINGVALSFTDYSLIKPTTNFIGLQNYRNIFTDPVYWEVLFNSLFIVIISVAIQMSLGLAVALLLNKRIPFRGVFRSSVFLIWIVPMIVVSLLWLIIFNSEFGILNYVLKSMGIVDNYVDWLGKTWPAKFALIMVYGWRGVPYFMVMILAGLQTVPTTITDAATIDGANSFQRFFIIILPFIKHILILAALLSTVRLFQDITLIFILTSGGPVYSTTTLAIHVYKLAFDSFQMGKAASIGVTWLILLFFLAIFYVRMVTQNEFRK